MPSYTKKVDLPGKSSKELYDAVSQDIERFLSKASIGKYEIERKPEDKKVVIKGSIFSATLICRDAQMQLDAQLSLLAMPFKSKLDEGITRWLNKTFNIT
ncbi:MAG: polyhydroxyalkanoic acid system family protein [Bdellovibrio sp.]|nr:polyhydroxyalkanoic acid system family protein [Bdellovibrio sp.]